MMHNVVKWFVGLGVAAFAATGLIGCGGGGGTMLGDDPQSLFVNASPDSDVLDFWLNETLFGDALTYLEATTDFVSFEFISDDEGAYDVVISDPGTGFEYDSQNRVFRRDTHTIIVSVGLKIFVPGEEIKRLQHTVLIVDRVAPLGNKARFYIVHGFTREVGKQTPAISFQNPGDNPQYRAANIEFAGAAVLTVDSGNMDWVARREDAGPDTVFATINQTVDPGGVYLVLVSGIENDADPAKLPKITFIPLSTVDP